MRSLRRSSAAALTDANSSASCCASASVANGASLGVARSASNRSRTSVSRSAAARSSRVASKYSEVSAAISSFDTLLEDYHIYLTRDGRMSIAGLKSADIEYVAAAIKEVLER